MQRGKIVGDVKKVERYNGPRGGFEDGTNL
jgi:hypothetical protein